jgi:hypothetical protein
LLLPLVYPIYQHGPHFTLRRIELIDATILSGTISRRNQSDPEPFASCATAKMTLFFALFGRNLCASLTPIQL